MSASKSPTRNPRRASETARLAATVLFPTPPFPELTAMTFFTCGNILPGSGRGAWADFTAISTFTSGDTKV